MIKFYKVGGYVRDEILCVKSKDIDYAVEAPSYEAMRDYIALHGKIYQERPQYFTIRAKINDEDCDYVLCRKEGSYTDGRRPDTVEPGSIYDDLARRDFTCNAIAIDENGNYVDPHGGIQDLKAGVLRCVGDAYDRFTEDSLRLLRALRFSITKNLTISPMIHLCLKNQTLIEKLENVSIERMREELYKCFAFDTIRTLQLLSYYYELRDAIFGGGDLFLVPTIRNKTHDIT